MCIYIYTYIYIYIYTVFTIEVLFEVAIESWSKWSTSALRCLGVDHFDRIHT